jgi:hypothetical protein
MKKLLFIILMLPQVLFAQLRSGQYKLSLVTNAYRMEFASGNFIRVAEDCRARTYNCGNQVWQVTGLSRLDNSYSISLVGSGGKYLTWDYPVNGLHKLQISLQNRYPTAKLKHQKFLIVINDKGSYQIQPAIEDGGGQNNYFLGATLASGAHHAVGFYKDASDNPVKEISNAWVFAPPITPLPVQNAGTVIVSAPSDNKLDVDIKTGSDNLEMKPFQGNVDIRIKIDGKPDAVLLNANQDQSWPNNSIKRVSIPLPADVTVDQIKEIQISRLRKSGPTTTIFNIAEKDNWNVDGVIVNANIKTNNAMKRTKLLEVRSRGRVPGTTGHTIPYFRFVYLDGDLRANEGELLKLPLSPNANIIIPPPAEATVVVNPVIKIETLTGGDDLRGGNDNLNVLIRLKIRPVRNITLSNINNRQSWGNFTEHTVNRSISAPPFTFDDIEDIVLRHTGGAFGQGIDNWYLDKLKITLTIAGETRVLIDQVSAPIHYFKGDSRSKTFQISR